MSSLRFVTIGRIVGALAGVALTIVLFSHTAAVSAQAALPCWTAVGSDGTVDEADLGTVALSSNTAAVLGTVANATVDIRYDVVAVDGIFGGEGKTLAVRFADKGPDTQVIVRLRQLNISSGVLSMLAELDSDDYTPSPVAQRQSVGFGCGGEFDFEKNIYYVEVELRKTGAGGNPLIRAIQICGNHIC